MPCGLISIGVVEGSKVKSIYKDRVRAPEPLYCKQCDCKAYTPNCKQGDCHGEENVWSEDGGEVGEGQEREEG